MYRRIDQYGELKRGVPTFRRAYLIHSEDAVLLGLDNNRSPVAPI